MDKHRNLIPYALIFSSFLLLGFWTGDRLSPVIIRAKSARIGNISNAINHHPSSATLNYPIPPQIPESDDNPSYYTQTNYLFLFVDNLESKNPQLLSAWLLISTNNNARWIIFPIAENSDQKHTNTSLLDSFELTSDHQLSKRFIRSVDERQILWHHYFLLDTTALVEINTILGYTDRQNTVSNPLYNLCQGLNNQPFALSSFNSLIVEHFLTDTDINRTFDDWQLQIIQNGGLYCEFPSQ